jgi:hypothetical protein
MNDAAFYLWTGIAGALYSGFAALRYYSLSGTQLISAARAKKMIKSGEIKHVVDVRSKFEWDFGHYPGAVHMPVNVISQRIVSRSSTRMTDINAMQHWSARSCWSRKDCVIRFQKGLLHRWTLLYNSIISHPKGYSSDLIDKHNVASNSSSMGDISGNIVDMSEGATSPIISYITNTDL